MAQIDTSIYGNMLRPVKSVADYDAEYETAQANKLARMLQGQTMSMNQMTMDEKRRGVERQNKLQALLGGMGGATDEDRISALRGGAYFPEADALERSIFERKKTQAEIDAKKAGTAKDYAELVKKGLGFVFANPSPEAANSAISILEQQTGKDLSAYRQQIAGFTTPEQFKQWAAGHALEVNNMLPKTQTTNLGGNMSYEAVNPITAQVTQTGVKPITQSEDNKATNLTSTNNNIRSVGAQREIAQATRAAAATTAEATRDAAKIKGNMDAEMKLGDDYRGQSKSFKSAAEAYEQLMKTIGSATKSPAATLAAATKFMKVIDPDSVVRESELGMALKASGVLDRAANYLNTLDKGQVLTETQAADFKNISKQIFAAAQTVQKRVDDDYKNKAKTYGLRPEMIVQDLGQNSALDDVPDDIKAILKKHGSKKP